MIQIFKKNDIVNIIALLPYVIIVRLYSLIHPNSYVPTESDTQITQWIFSEGGLGMLSQSIIAIILVYFQAILINMLANNNRIYHVQCGYASMFYVLFTSFAPGLQVLSPILIGAFFIILATFNVFQVYKMANATTNIFNAALLSAIATLIYSPFFFVAIAFFIQIGILRSFSIRERLQYLTGYGVIFWIVGSFCYYLGWLEWPLLVGVDPLDSVLKLWSSPIESWVYVLVSLLLVIIALMGYYNNMKKKGIEVRKKIDFFYWFLLAALVSFLFMRDLSFTHLHYLAFPMSIFFAMSFSQVKNTYRLELMHFVIILAVFLSLFKTYVFVQI